jgi:hypothetical protein
MGRLRSERPARGRLALVMAAVVVAGLASGVAARPALADSTVTVATTSAETTPDGVCSLPEAIYYAEGKNGGNNDCGGTATGTTTINLPAGVFSDPNVTPLVIAAGGPGTVVINGVGTGIGGTIIDGEGLARTVGVAPGATVILRNLTVRGGWALDGGGIYNEGTLTLDHVLVTGNVTEGEVGEVGLGRGGGIFNSGTLYLTDSTVSGNSTGAGGVTEPAAIGDCVLLGSLGLQGGDGGGLYNQDGTVNVTDSVFTGNTTGPGGDGTAGSDASGTCSGGGEGGDGAAGGAGGAIYNNGGFLHVNGSAIYANTTGDGGTGANGGYSPIEGGRGGGGGQGGSGAGLFINGGMVTVLNTTIAGNSTGQGGLGAPGGMSSTPARHGEDGQGGPGGDGGAILQANGQANVQETTIALNTGGAGGYGPGTQDGTGGAHGAAGTSGIYVWGGELTEVNTIDSQNNCAVRAVYGQINDGFSRTDGHQNLSWYSGGCPGTNANPVLGPLQGNGGPTPTMAIAPPSAAIGRIAPTMTAGCTATDQRGVARPQPRIGKCDIGAFEYAP